MIFVFLFVRCAANPVPRPLASMVYRQTSGSYRAVDPTGDAERCRAKGIQSELELYPHHVLC